MELTLCSCNARPPHRRCHVPGIQATETGFGGGLVKDRNCQSQMFRASKVGGMVTVGLVVIVGLQGEYRDWRSRQRHPERRKHIWGRVKATAFYTLPSGLVRFLNMGVQ